MRAAPTVDVIIPVHQLERAVGAAASSAQSSHQGVMTRVFVVLHNLDPADAERLHIEVPVTFLHCDDGLHSPSGPRNVGLAAASAPFVFFLDSDDRLSERCLHRLHCAAESTGADVALPSLLIGGRYVGTPLACSRRPRRLDVVSHDLFLRSHVPALLRRSMLDRTGVRYPEGIRTGEDFTFMSELLASVPCTLALDAVYEGLDPAGDRASTPLPPDEQFAATRKVLAAEWVDALSPAARELLVRRILSVNVGGTWRRSVSMGARPSRAGYVEMRDEVVDSCPSAQQLLSVRDRVSLRFTARPGIVERLLLSPGFGLVPSSLRGLGGRGTLAREGRSWIVRHRPRRNDPSV